MTQTFFNIYQQLTSVRLADVSNLTGVYFNGSLNNGVGATLTATSLGALVIDGVNAELGDRVLLKSQTSVNQDGIYTVSNAGSAISLWKLQRAPDFQSIEQLKAGQYFSVSAGNTLGGSMFILIEPLPNAIGSGTTSFNFSEIGGGGGGPFLTVAGNLSDVANSEFSVNNLGLGSGVVLLLNDGDFTAGVYQLTNPCPNYVVLSCATPGNTLRLPPAQGLGSFALANGPIVSQDIGFQSVAITDASGGFIINTSSPDNIKFILEDKSTFAGLWQLQFNVTTVNGQSGNLILSSSTQTIYVANSGSDANGDGSVLFPYQTLSFAISQITTASSATPFEIQVTTGVYTETNLSLKPWIYIEGNKSGITVSGSVTLDPSWSGGGGLASFSNFNGLSWPATVTLDFTGSSGSFFTFSNNFQQNSTTLNVIGDPTNGIVLLIENDIDFSSSWNYNITNCYGAISGGDTGNITINHTSETAGGNFSLLNLTQIGNFSATDNTTAGFTLFHEQCKVIGTASYTENGAGTFNAGIKGVQYFSTPPSIDKGVGGGNINFVADLLTALPTLVNGATYTPTSISDAMEANANFTPANYTPVAGLWAASSVTGNLAGIDAALLTATDTLQSAYDNGNGKIDLTASKPLDLIQANGEDSFFITSSTNTSNTPSFSISTNLDSATPAAETASWFFSKLFAGTVSAAFQYDSTLDRFLEYGDEHVTLSNNPTGLLYRVENNTNNGTIYTRSLVAKNDTNAQVEYGNDNFRIQLNTTGAEGGAYFLNLINNGVSRPFWVVDGLNNEATLDTTFTHIQNGSAFNSPQFLLLDQTGTSVKIGYTALGNVLDEKNWIMGSDNNQFKLAAYDDATLGNESVFEAKRVGATITSVDFPNGTLSYAGTEVAKILTDVNGVTIASSVGTSATALVNSQSKRMGNLGDATGLVSFTATNTAVTITLQPPYGTVFTAVNQAGGSAIVAGTPSPTIADGKVVGINSVVGGIEINILLALGLGDYNLFFSTGFTISN